MGVYSIDNVNRSSATFDFDSVAESALEPNMAGAYAIVAESECNYNSIMQAIGIHELSVLESTGAEMIYEAADVKGFFKKIKDFFLSILAKIAGLVKRFFAMIDQHAQNDANFVKKYKSQLLAVKSLRDFECQGYKFTNMDWSPSTASDKIDGVIKSALGNGTTLASLSSVLKATASSVTEADKEVLAKIIAATDDTEDVHDKMRGAAIGASSFDTGEFGEEIFKYFHGDETTKEDISTPSASDIITTISTTAKAKKTAKDAYTAIEKVINKEIKDLDKLESDIMKLVPGKTDDAKALQEYYAKSVSATSRTSAITKTKLAMINQVYGGLLTAIKDENSQARSIAIKMINYKPKNEGFDHYTEGTSFLDAVVLK